MSASEDWDESGSNSSDSDRRGGKILRGGSNAKSKSKSKPPAAQRSIEKQAKKPKYRSWDELSESDEGESHVAPAPKGRPEKKPKAASKEKGKAKAGPGGWGNVSV